jgi:hypothetical protein
MVFFNEICSFKPLFGLEAKDFDGDVICTSFFRMKNHYKGFEIYVNGLKRWSKTLAKMETAMELPRYKMIIFIDKHIYQDPLIMEIIKKNSLFLPILFTCSDFIEEEYHLDAFGTFVRFFPLFDFPENYTKRVFVVDVDLGKENLERFHQILRNEKPITVSADMEGFFNSNKLHVYAGLMFFDNVKRDRHILTEFIQNAHTLSDTGHYNRRLSTFGYGTDEMFINRFITQHVASKTIYCQINYNPNWFIYINCKLIKSNKAETFRIFKYIFGSYYTNQTLDKMISQFDEAFYKVHTVSDKVRYFSRRFYKMIKYTLKRRIDWIKRHEQKLIYKQFNNVISAAAFFKINVSDKKIIDVDVFEPTYV